MFYGKKTKTTKKYFLQVKNYQAKVLIRFWVKTQTEKRTYLLPFNLQNNF